jgi:hypothetical protein
VACVDYRVGEACNAAWLLIAPEFMPKLACLLTLFVCCAAAQTVEGVVLDGATGAGVVGVKAELLRAGSVIYDTLTDSRGHFRFDKVREGDYTDRYQSADHWLTAGWQDVHSFHAAEGNPVKLETRMMPWSKISGRVVDGRGNAVANARLELTGSGMLINGRTYVRTSWGGGGGGQLGQGLSLMTQSGNTDEAGKFEVQVMPGEYGLSVIPPARLKPPDPGEDGAALVWQRTYYPSVASAEAASKIVVFPGADISGVELKLRTAPVHAVRGVVLNPDGTPAAKVAIVLVGGPTAFTVESKPDGAFRFPAVAEGEWRVSAEVKKGSVNLLALQRVEVGKHDLEGLKIQLSAPLNLRVRAVLPPSRGAAPRLDPITFLVGGSGNPDAAPLDGLAAMAEPDADAEFVVREAYPGVYRLGPLFPQVHPAYYLDSMRVGAADLTTQEVEIASDAEITMEYKADGGSVAGKAENCASGGVLLVPADPVHRRPIFFRSGACDANEHYEVAGVRPGDYLALAFAGNGLVPAINDLLLQKAIKISVRAGESLQADLRAVTKPVY